MANDVGGSLRPFAKMKSNRVSLSELFCVRLLFKALARPVKSNWHQPGAFQMVAPLFSLARMDTNNHFLLSITAVPPFPAKPGSKGVPWRPSRGWVLPPERLRKASGGDALAYRCFWEGVLRLDLAASLRTRALLLDLAKAPQSLSTSSRLSPVAWAMTSYATPNALRLRADSARAFSMPFSKPS